MRLLVVLLAVLGSAAGFTCKKDGMQADPTDCNKYYWCQGSTATHFACGAGLYFNPANNQCDWPHNVDCNTDPTVPPEPTIEPKPTTKPAPVTTPAPTPAPSPTQPLPDHGKEVVCYFINWAWYRPGDGKYLPEDIDPKLCTIVNYAFAVLGWNKVTAMHDSWADKDNKFYERVVALKKAPGSKIKKVYLAIGGWNDSAGSKYSELVTDPAKRKKFIDHVVPFLQQYGFDGLDLDWEYPKCWQGDCRKGKDSEKKDFADWCDELKAAFKPHGLGLSAAVSASKTIVDAGYDVPRLAKSLDELNLMTYDFHGSWDKKTGHNAPMFPCAGDDIAFFNVDSAVNYWIQQGFPPRKIMLGLPIYGRSFKLDDPSNTGFNSPARDGGSAGKWTRAKGFLGYYEICHFLKEGWTKVKTPDCVVGPYAFKGDQWVGYDDLEAVKFKMNYVKEKKLGGGMVWDVSMDDFKGSCGEGKNPFLTAMNRYLA